MCQSLLTSHGIVVSEYERNPLDHGDITWIERKKVTMIFSSMIYHFDDFYLALVIYKYFICSS